MPTNTGLARTAIRGTQSLLGGFREFLGQLDAERAEQFKQPKPHSPRIDLVEEITATIGPSDGR
jgi:hypothetical protein